MTDMVRIPCVLHWEGEPEPDLSGLVDPVRIPILRTVWLSRDQEVPTCAKRIGFAPRDPDIPVVPRWLLRPETDGDVRSASWVPRETATRNAGNFDWSPFVRPIVTFQDPVPQSGNARIDFVAQRLLDLASEAAAHLGQRSGPLFGSRLHFEFARLVREAKIAGIEEKDVEQSFSLGDTVRYVTAGSIRTDVVLHDENGAILAVYDLKTGTAVLTKRRTAQIRKALERPSVPVLELRIDRVDPFP